MFAIRLDDTIFRRCHGMPWHAGACLPWHAMACHGMPWRALARHGIPWHGMSWHPVACVPWHAMACHDMPWHARPCHSKSIVLCPERAPAGLACRLRPRYFGKNTILLNHCVCLHRDSLGLNRDFIYSDLTPRNRLAQICPKINYGTFGVFCDEV